MSTQPRFTSYRMGDLDLSNRIVMASLTRMRARSDDQVPTTRCRPSTTPSAPAGLIVTEGGRNQPGGVRIGKYTGPVDRRAGARLAPCDRCRP
jgi:N-ethylmaleimide reductase